MPEVKGSSSLTVAARWRLLRHWVASPSPHGAIWEEPGHTCTQSAVSQKKALTSEGLALPAGGRHPARPPGGGVVFAAVGQWHVVLLWEGITSIFLPRLFACENP